MRRIATLATLFVVVLGACSGSSEPTATYTGGACDYDGPSEFDVNSTVTFTVTNESDTANIGFAVWKFPEGTTAEEVFNEGIINVVAGDGYEIDFVGAEYDLTVTFNETGQHGINCFELGGADYVAMFTVVE